MGIGTRAMRWVTVWGMMIGIVVTLVSPAAFVRADQPATNLRGSSTSWDPRLPGNHAAADAYFASLHQGAAGGNIGKARLDALAQAKNIPALRTVPAAAGGKGPKQALSPNLTVPYQSWQQLGPAPENSNNASNTDFRSGIVSGRVTAIAVGQHTGVIYIGTAGGGVWKSANDGASWTPLTDNQQSLAIGALALDPNDALDTTVYAGTGEVNGSDSYKGIGILKTTNGGANWTLLGASVFGPYSNSSAAIARIAFGNTAIWAATTKGLYYSTDGGANWTLDTVASANTSAWVIDLIVDGANIYAVMSDVYTGSSHAYYGIYKSTNNGGVFSPIMSGLPTGSSWRRGQVAIARSNTQTLYLSIGKSDGTLLGMYKTINGGSAWNPTATPPPPPLSQQPLFSGMPIRLR